MDGHLSPGLSPFGKRKRDEEKLTPLKSATKPTSTVARLEAPATEKYIPKTVTRGGSRGLALLAAAGGKSAPAPAVLTSTPLAVPQQSVSQATSEYVTPNKINPGSTSLAKQPLPKHYAALVDMFAALQTVYQVMRRRGLRTTFESMKQAVEEACGKRFTTANLAQLQTLLPEVITLEWIRLPVTPQSTRTAHSLLITLQTPEDQPDQSLSDLRAALRCNLATHLLSSYATHLSQQTDKASKGVSLEPPVVDFLPPFPEAAPEVPPTPLPVKPTANANANSRVQGPSPAIIKRQPAKSSVKAPKESNTDSTTVNGSQDTVPSNQSGKPPLPPGAVDGAAAAEIRTRRGRLQQRRLSFGKTLDMEGESDGNKDHEGKFVNGEEVRLSQGLSEDQTLLASMPEGLRRRSMDGIISMDTLRALDANEKEHCRLSSDAAREAREANAALAALPQTFARLQRIFGSKGPTAMKLADVVKRIKEGGAETTSVTEVEAQLKALAAHAPEYAQLKAWGSCGTPAVWINRRCDGNAVVSKLRKVAEERLKKNKA